VVAWESKRSPLSPALMELAAEAAATGEGRPNGKPSMHMEGPLHA
jgi:hypothetical protein